MVKNVIIVLLAIAIILLVITRQSNNTPSGNTRPPLMETFALDSAKAATQRFRSEYQKAFKAAAPINSFTMRGIDALEVLGRRKYLPADSLDFLANTLAFRVYLGLDDSLRFKLFVVKVSGVNFREGNMGKDLPFIEGAQSGAKGKGVGSEFVLDVNKPCPSTCPNEPIL